MEEMMSYIFGTMHNCEAAVGGIYRVLKKQKRFNTRMTAFAIGVVVFAAVADGHRKWQDEKIEKLEKEIRDLRDSKGE